MNLSNGPEPGRPAVDLVARRRARARAARQLNSLLQDASGYIRQMGDTALRLSAALLLAASLAACEDVLPEEEFGPEPVVSALWYATLSNLPHAETWSTE